VVTVNADANFLTETSSLHGTDGGIDLLACNSLHGDNEAFTDSGSLIHFKLFAILSEIVKPILWNMTFFKYFTTYLSFINKNEYLLVSQLVTLLISIKRILFVKFQDNSCSNIF